MKHSSAIILAGGKSRRMGFNKEFLTINNRRVIKNTIEKLSKEFREVVIVSNNTAAYKNTGLKVVSDEYINIGPLAGIHIGLKTINSKFGYFIACDMPVLNMDYIRYMNKQLVNGKADACVTKKEDRIEPFNAFYSKNALNKIEELINNNKRSVFALTKEINCVFINESKAREFSSNWDMFMNLNTIKDIEEYKNLGQKEYNWRL